MSVFFLAVLVMLLLGSGTYLILRQHAVKLILGLGLISHAFNLIIFGTTRLTKGQEPILDKRLLEQAGYPNPQEFADPLPHALILTAIVIGFGVTAYLIALVQRLHEAGSQTTASTLTAPRIAYLEVEHYTPGHNGAEDDHIWLEYVQPSQPVRDSEERSE